MTTGTIEDIRGIYKGKSIAVVASGPTARLFSNREDISIAVNGASRIFETDYFVCMDGQGMLFARRS